MNPIRLLNLKLIPPLQTQAVYHMLAERMTVDEPDTIILCRPNAPYLCLGYHQVFDSVFDADKCQRRGLPVLRRRLGGGATYLDANQLFYQCIFHHSLMPAMLKDIYQIALSAPVTTLKRLGLNAELRDVNEIEVDGKRIAGTGGGRIDEACVVVGNLLFDFDFEAMTSVWRTPSLSFRSLAEKALRERLVTLNQLGIAASRETIEGMLIEEFSRSFGRELQPDSLTAEELEFTKAMEQELVSDEFLSLHKERGDSIRPLKISARAFVHADEMQLDGFKLNGSFLVSQDLIQEVILESEPIGDWSSMEEHLQGMPFKQWKEQVLVR
ncbi:MAG: lipoate--protein ligase family protein [Chloroflexi bacterium]|nr:lipoate--protein ligase family protein [Chloroflexota bacterium]